MWLEEGDNLRDETLWACSRGPEVHFAGGFGRAQLVPTMVRAWYGVTVRKAEVRFGVAGRGKL